ncbi:small basic protein [Fontivita pretiosa]|uniref:small basic protein n=1 Tax=Fontivita pretiosa TaxID=2989684 RepID=UPI003D174BE8
MSLDRSLKSANSLIRHRNVLTRAERLAKLKEEERWDESKSVFGLPKVAHRKLELAKGGKEQAPAGVEGAAAPGAAPATAAAGAAPAAAKSAAAPAAASAKAAAAPAAAGAAAKAPAAAAAKKK